MSDRKPFEPLEATFQDNAFRYVPIHHANAAIAQDRAFYDDLAARATDLALANEDLISELQALREENERLKELQGVPGVSENGLLAVGGELIRLKTQLAEQTERLREAVAQLEAAKKVIEFYAEDKTYSCGTWTSAPAIDSDAYGNKAREFLAKVKGEK